MAKQEFKKGEIVIYKTSKNEFELRVRLEEKQCAIFAHSKMIRWQ